MPGTTFNQAIDFAIQNENSDVNSFRGKKKLDLDLANSREDDEYINCESKRPKIIK